MQQVLYPQRQLGVVHDGPGAQAGLVLAARALPVRRATTALEPAMRRAGASRTDEPIRLTALLQRPLALHLGAVALRERRQQPRHRIYSV
jgi:hypothetical protein